MKKSRGFTAIQALIVFAVFVVTLAGGVVVWQKRTGSTLAPTLVPFPTQALGPSTPPTQPKTTPVGCRADGDCPSPPSCATGSDGKPIGNCSVFHCVNGQCVLEKANTGSDFYTWLVERVCVPRCGPPFPWCPEENVVKNLNDGTLIYRRADGSLFRGTMNNCDCLPAETLISTPEGEVSVSTLQAGMLIWTLDSNGEKAVQPIINTSKVKVPSTHAVVKVTLKDRRNLTASPKHPTADGRMLGQLLVGEILDNSLVVSLEFIPYQEDYTYDLLPAGETGFYWANGILLKSTLLE